MKKSLQTENILKVSNTEGAEGTEDGELCSAGQPRRLSLHGLCQCPSVWEPRLTGETVSGILLDNLVRSADSAVDAGSAGLIRKHSYLPSLRSIEFLH
jgi:hypothetical protein